MKHVTHMTHLQLAFHLIQHSLHAWAEVWGGVRSWGWGKRERAGERERRGRGREDVKKREGV